MKKCKLVGCVVLMICAMIQTGCAEVPKEVQEDIAARGEMQESETDRQTSQEVSLVPIKEVIEHTPSEWKADAGVAHFDGTVHVPDTDELCKWKVEITNEVFQNPEKTREAFLKYCDNLDVKQEYEDEDGFFKDYIDYADDATVADNEGTNGIGIYEWGKVAMVMLSDYWKDVEKTNEWLYFPPEKLSRVTSYEFDANGRCVEGGTDSYKLYNQESISIQESMDTFDDVIQSYLTVEPGLDIRPDRVIVFYNEAADCYLLDIHEILQFDGVPVDEATLPEQDVMRFHKMCRLGATLYQNEYGSGAYPYWTYLDGAYKTTDKLESYDSIIDFESAWGLVSAVMADEKDVTIDRADLLYSIYYMAEHEDADILWQTRLTEPPQMYAEPVWRFVSYQGDGSSPYVYYVNAVTGEVMAYENGILD